jgi:hypothetical protein
MPESIQTLVDRLNKTPDVQKASAYLHRRRLAVTCHILARALVHIFSKRSGLPEDYRLLARTALEQAKWWAACPACHKKVRLEAERRPEYEI